MVSRVIEATAPLRRPVSADKALAASEKLLALEMQVFHYEDSKSESYGLSPIQVTQIELAKLYVTNHFSHATHE